MPLPQHPDEDVSPIEQWLDTFHDTVERADSVDELDIVDVSLHVDLNGNVNEVVLLYEADSPIIELYCFQGRVDIYSSDEHVFEDLDGDSAEFLATIGQEYEQQFYNETE